MLVPERLEALAEDSGLLAVPAPAPVVLAPGGQHLHMNFGKALTRREIADARHEAGITGHVEGKASRGPRLLRNGPCTPPECQDVNIQAHLPDAAFQIGNDWSARPP